MTKPLEIIIEAIGKSYDSSPAEIGCDTLAALQEAGFAVVPVERLSAELSRAIRNIMNIETEAMHGDNLAVTLCSHFENPDQEDEEEGWTQDALDAYAEIKEAIEARFATVRAMIQASQEPQG